MSGISKYFILLILVTFSMLFFVHQQISIVQCSYQINKNKALYSKLSEENRNLKLALVAATTPNIIQEKLANAKVNLTYPSEISLIRIQAQNPTPFMVASLKNEKNNSFNMLKMLGFENVAQAEVSE